VIVLREVLCEKSSVGIPSHGAEEGRMKMGKFEDLIQLAKDGDTEALETLEKEFGGSNLRDQVEAAAKAAKDNEPYIRSGKFNALKAELGDVDLNLEDLEGTDTQDFSEDLLRLKAEEKQAKMAAFKEDAAKAAGFASVEEYDKALESVKQKQTASKEGLEALGGATASSSGGQAPPEESKEPWDESLEAYKEAKKTGSTQDVAHGIAAHALMTAQHPEAEDLP